MRFACVPVAILACACGRIGFGGTAQGDGGGTDAPDDGALVDMPDDIAMPIDAPPSLCGSSTANMCDGFEAPAIDARWNQFTNRGALSPDTTRAYRGASSLHAHIDAIATPAVANPGAEMRSYDGLPVANTAYVRVFIYIAGANASRFTQYVNFSNDSGLGASVGEENDKIINNNYAAQPPDYLVSTTVFPHDQWTCLVYQVPSDANGTMRVFVDGTEVTDLQNATTNHPAPTHVYIGIDIPSTVMNQGSTDVWLDEVIVDNAPISCAD